MMREIENGERLKMVPHRDFVVRRLLLVALFQRPYVILKNRALQPQQRSQQAAARTMTIPDHPSPSADTNL